ncbi:MAG: hypothetical protein [Microviridae sp.]|nr:MAG: hypothetical protein [Microviridae sp.]
MFKEKKPYRKTSILRNESTEGEMIEVKCSRIVNNKEPIKDGVTVAYERRDVGVAAERNIRSDRFELAVDAMGAVTKSGLAKRDAFYDELNRQNEELNQGDKDKADGTT